MKKLKLFLTLLAILVLLSCQGDRDSTPNEPHNQTQGNYVYLGWGQYKIVTIDSCEYIFYQDAEGVSVVHHEGCSNPKHQR